MYTIKKITSQQTFPVRLPVLRPGKPVESCIFDGDDLPATVHFGIYDDDAIVGVVSIFESRSPLFDDERQFQLRGMAVLDTHQKQGLGEKLVQAAEEYIQSQGGGLIWFNAREIAVGFYRKMGYEVIDEPFSIGDIGIHYVMWKMI
jgi:ribosomal protein S18 acetylase RimI-like enzyme